MLVNGNFDNEFLDFQVVSSISFQAPNFHFCCQHPKSFCAFVTLHSLGICFYYCTLSGHQALIAISQACVEQFHVPKRNSFVITLQLCLTSAGIGNRREWPWVQWRMKVRRIWWISGSILYTSSTNRIPF